MKKILVLTLALALSLSLCACGNSAAKEESAEAETAAAVEEAAEVAEEVSEALEADMTSVKESDPVTDTKEAGTPGEKILPTEDGDKGFDGWSARELANYSNANCEACLTLINDTGVGFKEIYIAPTTATRWGTDVLGTRCLWPGEDYETKLLYNRESLSFDVRIVDVNDNKYQFEEIDIGELDNCDISFAFYMENGTMMVRY